MFQQPLFAGGFVEPATPVMFAPGYYAGGIHGAGATKRNDIKLNPLVFASCAYAWQRGGTRLKFVPLQANANYNKFSYLSRAFHRNAFEFVSFASAASNDAVADLARIADYSNQGSLVYPPSVAHACEVPYASSRRMIPTTPATTTTTLHESRVVMYLSRLYNSAGSSIPLNLSYEAFMAAGEDYSLLYFRGVPTLYKFSG